MTLTELRYIVILAKEQHFGRAAQQCHVSQPSLSVAVKKLEDELGIHLFERNRNSITPTPEGKPIIDQAKLVLQESERVKEIAQLQRDPLAAPLKLGAILTVGPYLFPHMIQQLKQIESELKVYLEEGFTRELRQQLTQGELDAIIVARPFTEPNTVVKDLYEEPFVALLPKGHRWESKQSVRMDDLVEEDLLLLGEGHCFRDQVLEACPALRQQLQQGGRYVTEASSLETIKQMVASGLGITILPQSAAGFPEQQKDWVVQKPITAPTPKRVVALAWRQSFTRPKAIDAITAAISQCPLSKKVAGAA